MESQGTGNSATLRSPVPRIMYRVPKSRRQDAEWHATQQCPSIREMAPGHGRHPRYRSILGTLSLFSKDTPECEVKNDGTWKRQPVSSISEDHICPPASLSDLRRMLLDRMQKQCILHPVSEDDRQALAVVVISELGLIWQDLGGVRRDPLLTQDENKHLCGKMFCEVLGACERLYGHYLQLLGSLKKRGVFSDQANRSRLCAQMATDCTALLNIRLIRHRVTAEIKAARVTGFKLANSSDRHGQERAPDTHSFSHIPVCESIKKSDGERQRKAAIERDLQEITEKIGDVNLEHLYDLIPYHLEEATSQEDSKGTADCSVNGASEKEDINISLLTKLRGSRSMPALRRETLLGEMDFVVPLSRAPSPLVLLNSGPSRDQEEPVSAVEDLRRLIQDDSSADEPESEDPGADLPPLIRVLPRSSSTKLQRLQQHLQRLAEQEKRAVAGKAVVAEPGHPQSAAVTVPLPSKSVTRAAGPRVSDRVFFEAIQLQLQPPVYPDLTGEIETSSVRWIDQNLHFQEEVREVYCELSKTISTQHLNFDVDLIVEPVPVEECYKNSLPYKRKKQSLFNPRLEGSSTYSITNRKTEVPSYEKPQDMESKAYTNWLQWWKSNLSLDDYLKFISSQNLDYLGVVFHLYNSDDDNEEEDEKRGTLTLLLEEKKKRRRQKIDSLKRKKDKFVTGVWNVNSVLLGGLWNEPPLDEEDLSSTPTQEGEVQPGGIKCGAEGGGLEHDCSQVRLEGIWNTLCFPDNQRLDMAIKYSLPSNRNHLQEALTTWENAARLIQQREALLSQLELFEREASDPDRFFQHGYRGTSIARMDESRRRQKLHKQISSLEEVLSKDVRCIWDRFHDTVTYRGRPYEQKMRWDRTEMLYWLQQERRVQALHQLWGPQRAAVDRLPPLEQDLALHCGFHSTSQEQNPQYNH